MRKTRTVYLLSFYIENASPAKVSAPYMKPFKIQIKNAQNRNRTSDTRDFQSSALPTELSGQEYGILRNRALLYMELSEFVNLFFEKFASRNYLDESGREEDNDSMRMTLKGQKEEDKNGTFTCGFLF